MHNKQFATSVSPCGCDAHSLAVWRLGAREQVRAGWFPAGAAPPPVSSGGEGSEESEGSETSRGLVIWSRQGRLQTHAGGQGFSTRVLGTVCPCTTLTTFPCRVQGRRAHVRCQATVPPCLSPGPSGTLASLTLPGFPCRSSPRTTRP